MSTTDTIRAAFEALQKPKTDLNMKRDRYMNPVVQSRFDGFISGINYAATEAAKAESQDDNKPAMYCVPDKDGKPLFGKGWMFSPIPHLAATMPLYTRPAAKATGTADQKPIGMVAKSSFGGHKVLVATAPLDDAELGAKLYIHAARQPAPVLSDEQIDHIARSYFAEEWAQHKVVCAIHDALLAARSQP